MKSIFRRPRPDGLAASVLLAILASAGIFYVNIMAGLVDGLRTDLLFSARDAGFVASANIYGAAVGALAAVFTTRWPWRRVALVVLVLLIAIDLGSMTVRTVPLMIAVRLVHGMIGGFLVGTAFAVIARTRAPDRVFAVLVLVQYGLGGAALFFLPPLVPLFGARILFLCLAAFSLVALALLPLLSAYPRPAPVAGVDQPAMARGAWGPLAAALGAVFVFQAASMIVMAYVIGLGKAYGLDPVQVSEIVGAGVWAGIIGAAAVMVLGVRHGRTAPLMVGLAGTLVGAALFLRSDVTAVFIAANVLISVMTSFALPYLFGLCSAFDLSGRSAALAGFCSKMGLASGPFIGGLLLNESHYDRLVLSALAGFAICAVAAWGPVRRLDARPRPDA